MLPAGLNRNRNLTEAPKQIDKNRNAKRKSPAPLINATHTHILGLITFEHHTVGPGAVCEARGGGAVGIAMGQGPPPWCPPRGTGGTHGLGSHEESC